MREDINLKDHGLGYGDSSALGIALIGQSSAGVANQLVGIGEPQLAYDTFVSGQLADRGAFTLTNGKGPLYAMRAATSTPGTAGTVAKADPPGSTGATIPLPGAMRLAGADWNGDVIIQAKDPDATLTVVVGMSAAFTAVGKDVTLTVTAGTTGAGVAALSLAGVSALINTPVALGTGASVCIQALAKVAFLKGSASVGALTNSVRYKTVVAGAANAALDVSASGRDVTITLGTDGNTQIDPAKNTEALVQAKVAAVAAVAAIFSFTALGDGTGLIGQQSTFQALSFGSTGAISVSGAPVDTWPVTILVTRAGAAGTAAIRVALDDLLTYGGEEIIPGGGTYAIPDTGITLTFTGTFAVGDTFTFATVGPVSTTGDLSAALTALAASPTTWEGVYVSGPLSGAQAAMIEAWVAGQRAVGRYFWVLGEARDNNPGESHATWAASILADFAGFTSTYGQLSIVAGYGEIVLPGLRGIVRRSLSWPVGAQITNVQPQKHPGQPVDAGPLPGIYTPSGGTGISHDERTQPGLGGSAGRFLTCQTLLGYPGQYFVGDGSGLRSPGTMAAGTSDYSLLMNVRVMMAICRALLVAGGQVLAQDEATKTGGVLATDQADKIDAQITRYLELQVVAKGYTQSVEARVSRTEPVLSSKHLPFTVKAKPWAYALWVGFDAGFAS